MAVSESVPPEAGTGEPGCGPGRAGRFRRGDPPGATTPPARYALEAVRSPNGGDTAARQALNDRFADRVSIDPRFTRRTVSYQGNRGVAGLRWMKYKEGFSRALVDHVLERYRPARVLDPFAGMGTTVLTAAGRGLRATGIEIMPVGVLAATGVAAAAGAVSRPAFEKVARALRARIASARPAAPEHAFPHVEITAAAFPAETERALARAREYVAGMEDGAMRTLANLACLSVLEDRELHPQGRPVPALGCPSRPQVAGEDAQGADPVLRGRARPAPLRDRRRPRRRPAGVWRGRPDFRTGSSLDLLKELPDGGFDMVITSPPYANRYDYTRTYALELAWLGYDRDGFKRLRQRMLSATVENRTKIGALRAAYAGQRHRLEHAIDRYRNQAALHEVLRILRAHLHELGNRHVVRLLEGYFLEMALVVTELGRLVRPGGTVIMVNDNVQYHGEEVPVDFILSDFAEQSGFACTDVWTLARGKGNASQQMGRFGRREIRKCVYRWERR